MSDFKQIISPDKSDGSDTLETLENEDRELTSVAPNEPVAESDAETTGDGHNQSPISTMPFYKRWIRHLNIYVLLFMALLLLVIVIIAVAYVQNKKTPVGNNLPNQSLSETELAKVANSDATVGSSNQVLTVQSSAIFAGKALFRKDLEVAGNLQIGGTLGLNNLAVNGTSQFAEAQINKDLSVAGNTALQGGLSVAKSLQVNGTASFSGALSAGQITTSSLQLNGDLVLSRHVRTTGTAPSRTAGTALGSGGTVTVGGTDTSGTVNINTGSSPAAGCFLTVNFATRYASTPRVVVTPIGPAGGGLTYYVNRSTSSFSICNATPPPGNASFGFDYFVVG